MESAARGNGACKWPGPLRCARRRCVSYLARGRKRRRREKRGKCRGRMAERGFFYSLSWCRRRLPMAARVLKKRERNRQSAHPRRQCDMCFFAFGGGGAVRAPNSPDWGGRPSLPEGTPAAPLARLRRWMPPPTHGRGRVLGGQLVGWSAGGYHTSSHWAVPRPGAWCWAQVPSIWAHDHVPSSSAGT